MFHRSSSRSGFTLMEMAIVMVIIGLLVGGVMVGKSMVHSAMRLNAIKDEELYRKSIEMFRKKYHYLPGDFPNATSMWGAANSDPNTCHVTSGTGTRTCDGNGDGEVDSYEALRLWQHLANEGLISGKYSGIWPGNNEIGYRDTASLPQTMSNAVFYVEDLGDVVNGVSSTVLSSGHYGYVIEISGTGGDITTAEAAPGVYPSDARAIDLKVDDGLPYAGSIRVAISGDVTSPTVYNNCATTYDGSNTSATYMADSGPTCLMFFITGL